MDDFLEALAKHGLALAFVFIFVVVFVAGYASGERGQWWWGFGVLLMYPVILRIFGAGH